jgi:hypothetical protein
MILRLVVVTWPTIGFVWTIVATHLIVGLAQVIVTFWTILGPIQACVATQPIVGLVLVVATPHYCRSCSYYKSCSNFCAIQPT